MKEQIKSHEAKMQKTLDVLSKELAAVRAGRANPAVLDKITVEYYGEMCIRDRCSCSRRRSRVLLSESSPKTRQSWAFLCGTECHNWMPPQSGCLLYTSRCV